MQKNQHLLFLLFLSIAHAQTASAMQEAGIVAKIESYLDADPEYVPQRGFVTTFILGESGNIVHASVQPDLTDRRVLDNRDVHSFKARYQNIVIPTDNVRAVQEEYKDEYGFRLNQDTFPENQLAIYTAKDVRTYVPYNPISLASRSDIVTADIPFSTVKQLTDANFQNTQGIFSEKTPQDAAKIIALLAAASKSFSTIHINKAKNTDTLNFLLDDLEQRRAVLAAGECYAYDIYPNEKGEMMDHIVWQNLDDKQKLEDAMPFEHATLAVHKDRKRLHAFIKSNQPIDAQPRAITTKIEQEVEKTMPRIEAVASSNISEAPQNDAVPSSSVIPALLKLRNIFGGFFSQMAPRAQEQQQDSQQ